MESEIYSFDPETAECRYVAKTLEEWAEKILGEYAVLTGYPIAHDWQKAHGILSPRDRLVPKQLFVFGGEFSINNLVSVDSAKSMRIRGPIAQQIHNTPDGTKIELKVVDWQPIAE